MTSPINYRAVRAFTRIWRPIAANMPTVYGVEEECDRVISLVAARFNIAPNELTQDIGRYDQENFEEYYKRTVLGQ